MLKLARAYRKTLRWKSNKRQFSTQKCHFTFDGGVSPHHMIPIVSISRHTAQAQRQKVLLTSYIHEFLVSFRWQFRCILLHLFLCFLTEKNYTSVYTYVAGHFDDVFRGAYFARVVFTAQGWFCSGRSCRLCIGEKIRTGDTFKHLTSVTHAKKTLGSFSVALSAFHWNASLLDKFGISLKESIAKVAGVFPLTKVRSKTP